jgi:hypothetical protein
VLGGRRSSRRAGIAIAASIALCASLCGVAQAQTETRPELTAVTVLHGSHSGYLPVHIGTPTRMSLEIEAKKNPNVHIEGGGPVTGVVLRQDVAIAHPPKFWPGQDPGLGAVIIRPNPAIFCSGACESAADALLGMPLGDFSSFDVKLPPGDYRLYLIATSPDARVTLTLPNLPSGQQDLTPAHDLRSDFAALDRRDPLTGENQHAVFGRDLKPPADALMLNLEGHYLKSHVVTDSQSCFYEGGAPGLPTDYDMGCLVTASGAEFTNVVVWPQRLAQFSWGVYAGIPPGTYGWGNALSTVSPVESVGALNGWIEYGPPPEAPAAAPLVTPTIKTKRTAKRCRAARARRAKGARARACRKTTHGARAKRH